MENLNQAQVRQIAIDSRSGPPGALLYRMRRKLKGDPASCPDAFAHPFNQLKMMAIARRQIRAGLRDPDNRLSRHELLLGHPVVQIPLDIERHHAGVALAIKPPGGPQLAASSRHLRGAGRHGRQRLLQLKSAPPQSKQFCLAIFDVHRRAVRTGIAGAAFA